MLSYCQLNLAWETLHLSLLPPKTEKQVFGGTLHPILLMVPLFEGFSDIYKIGAFLHCSKPNLRPKYWQSSSQICYFCCNLPILINIFQNSGKFRQILPKFAKFWHFAFSWCFLKDVSIFFFSIISIRQWHAELISRLAGLLRMRTYRRPRPRWTNGWTVSKSLSIKLRRMSSAQCIMLCVKSIYRLIYHDKLWSNGIWSNVGNQSVARLWYAWWLRASRWAVWSGICMTAGVLKVLH